MQARSRIERPIDGSRNNQRDTRIRDHRWLQSETRLGDSESPSEYHKHSKFPFLRVRTHVQKYGRYRCIASCTCSCHTVHRFRSPPSLDAFLGVLFIGYSCSIAGISERCSQVSCKRDPPFDGRIEYTFPDWFLYNVCAALSVSSTGDPALCLQITRARSGGPDIRRLVKNNDIRGLQALYTARKASPVDIYVFGQTALSVSRPSLPDIQFVLCLLSAPFQHARLQNHTSHSSILTANGDFC